MNAPRRLAGALAGGLVIAACSSGGSDDISFGIRRIALDVAFVDEDAAPPVEPEVIVRLIPAPPEAFEPDFDFGTVTVRPDAPPPELPPLPPLPDACPTAPPEATVELVASPAVLDPPSAGLYLRRNSGQIELIGTGLPLVFPYPFLTAWEVSPEFEVERPGPLGTPGVAARQFTVTKTLGFNVQVIETLEIAEEAVLLVERVTITDGVETRFRTDPPVEVFHFGAEGDDWTSAGADVEHGYGVVVQGVIEDRQVIDVCGTLVDTFQIAYTERVVNLETGETTGTDSDQPTTIFYAPQFGGLVIQEDVHSSERTTAPDGSPALVNYDYVSTIQMVVPT